MASASTSPSRAPTTTSSSAWSRLVQKTRVASSNSRSQSIESSKSPTKASPTPSQEPTPVRPAKRRRLAEPTPTQSATDTPHDSASQSRAVHVSSTRHDDSRTLYPSAGSAECTLACSCRVEDVECVAPPRLKRKSSTQTPSADLRALWASPRDGGTLKRQAQRKTSNLELTEEDSGHDEPHTTAQQLLDSPTRSSDSISEVEIGDCYEDRGLKLHRDIVPSSSQSHQHTEERSIHDIGAVFAPKRKQLFAKSVVPPPRNLSQRSPAFKFFRDQREKSVGASTEQDEDQQGPGAPSSSDGPSITPTQPHKFRCGSPNADGSAIEAGPVSVPVPTCVAAVLHEVPQPEDGGLQDGDPNSLNKTPKSERRHINPTTQGDDNQLITPSTSPTSESETLVDENQDDESMPPETGPAGKAKRRLNLHSSSYAGQPSKKKRKTPPKKQVSVQTTLSLTIGGGSGMRECKVCDTVYNPFHPEDAKVHAKRHAVVLKNGTGVC